MISKEKQSKIRSDIDSSTIPEMLKVLYLLANATETLSQQSFQRIKAVFVKNGVEPKENDMLTGINDYCRSVKLSVTQFYKYIEPHIKGATFDVFYERGDKEMIENAIASYDDFNSDSCELIRLILLYVDRTAKNNDNYAKVFKTLRMMPSCGLFEDKDIARFKQK